MLQWVKENSIVPQFMFYFMDMWDKVAKNVEKQRWLKMLKIQSFFVFLGELGALWWFKLDSTGCHLLT
jgi:hypothetical protein